MKRTFAPVRVSAWLAVAGSLLACPGEPPTGLLATPAGSGPRIVWDLDAKPLPEVPFPIDVITRGDPTSPTGRRINVSTHAPTEVERKLRRRANRMDGFGTYAPISVRFDAALDLDNIIRRQRSNKDFADDAVLLVNLQPGSPHFGKLSPLDFGHGNFPVTVAEPERYWEADPRATVQNLLFDTTNEDQNGNGVLDPGEDTDDDGWLDVPNLHGGTHPVDDVLTFYEKVTNTLIFRPVLPLEQESRYAVVLTRHLHGADGQPIRSPFPFVNHARQTEALRDLPSALALHGFALEDVAFTWAFTTQGVTRDLEALRRGIYGNGPFAYLAKEFPPDVTIKPALSEGARPHIVPISKLIEIASTVLPLAGASERQSAQMIIESLYNVDYLVHGEIAGPNFLADKDGIAEPGYPSDDDEVWELNRKTGEAFYQPQKLNFWCAIPRKDRGHGPPFPVVHYSHGHTSSRFLSLGLVGFMARYGIAQCGISAYGHGLGIPPDYRGLANNLLDALKVRPLFDALVPDRARDLDNDGVPDSGVDFWTSDLFHTRDMVRQSVFEQMLFTRALRSFDGVRRSTQDLLGTGTPGLAGDFDGDGIPDLGGPNVDYYQWGHSLGGILSAVLAGVEPVYTAAAPICYAAGLADVGLRTAQFGVPNSLILPVMGPVFIGTPDGTSPGGGPRVRFYVVARRNNSADLKTLAYLDGVNPGDKVRMVNLTNGESYTTYVDANRRFRVHLPADALDATRKRKLLKLQTTPPPATPPVAPDTTLLGDTLVLELYDGKTGPLKQRLDHFGVDVDFEGVRYAAGKPLVSLTSGLGLQRNTPRFRRIVGAFAQMFMDPGDPVNYAPHYFNDPLPSSDYDSAKPGAAVLLMPTLGDPGVSVATGIAGARAAGLIELYSPDPRYGKTVNEVLIDNHIVEGLSRMRRFDGREILMDPENFSQGRWVPDAPRLDPPLRLTRAAGKGLQALRLPMLDPKGQHCSGIPEPTKTFDNNTFLLHLVGRYFQTRGQELRDNDLCMADQSCAWMPANAPAPPP